MATITEPETTVAPEPAPKHMTLRRRVMSRISIQSKLLVMLLVTSILSAAVVGFIGYQSGRSSLRASVFDRLTEVRASQSRQLEAKFADLEDSLITYTRGATTTEAIQAFTPAFDQLNDATINPAQSQSMVDYYNNSFRTAEQAQTGNNLDVDALLPTSNAQKYLQAYYTAPFNDWDKAIRFDDARDGSAWSAANARFNDFFREIVLRFQFEDALLLDNRGNVVYTAYKGVDLGTNILTGPYREGELRDAYQKALASNAVDYVGVTDFGDYQPADEPTAWMVSPVGPEGRVEGVLALQFPISKISRLMTADRQWEAAGMGNTGETFLVGPDGLMRSDSRLFLENPEDFKRDVVNAGTPPDVAEESIRQGGTTLVQPVATEATRMAQRGQSGTIIEDDYLGHETLQAYAPVDLRGLNWSIIAKVDTSEAFAPVATFTRTLVLSTAVNHLRGVHRRDAAGSIVRAAYPSARSGRPTYQLRRLPRHPARAVTRRIRRPDSGVQRYEPQPVHQRRVAGRATARERQAAVVVDARAGGTALPGRRGDDRTGSPERHRDLRRHRRPR